MRNKGKLFEDDFVKSVPEYCWHKRLNDNAASFAGGNNTRFSSTNECDFLIFDTSRLNLLCLELKSTIGSITFWREDFAEDGKKHTFMIKKNQIIGLEKWSKYDFVHCGFVFNFRNKDNRTFFVGVSDFLDFSSTTTKKSINMDDVLLMNPIEISCHLKRTRFSYDFDNLLYLIDLKNRK